MDFSGSFAEKRVCKTKYQYHYIGNKLPRFQITEQKCCLQDQGDTAYYSPEQKHTVAYMEPGFVPHILTMFYLECVIVILFNVPISTIGNMAVILNN